MAKNIVEFRCLLISPSDVTEERDAISDVVTKWNAQVGDVVKARIELVRWETHSVPDGAAPPQSVLNQQIVHECDFGIAVFWTRVGTATADHPSGSIEEIQKLRARGDRVMVYFGTAPIPQDALKDDQFSRLQQFKEEFQALAGSYGSVSDLREQVQLHLTKVVSGLLEQERGQPSPG